MVLDPDLSGDITVHTDRKDGTLHVLLIDEIPETTLDDHAERIAAVAGDPEAADEIKHELLQRAFHETVKAEVPEVFDPAIPSVVNISTERDVKLYTTPAGSR